MGPLDQGAGGFFERSCAARMVHMTVRDPDLLHREMVVLDRLKDPRRFPAGVDHGGLICGDAPHDRAVLLKRRNGCDDRADRGRGRSFGHGGKLGPHSASMQGPARLNQAVGLFALNTMRRERDQ